MARPYRLQSEDCFYHITSRGNDRKKIFLNDTDFEKFLEYILTAKEKYDFYLLAYVLMSNHYHLLIKTTKPNLSRIMHYIKALYGFQVGTPISSYSLCNQLKFRYVTYWIVCALCSLPLVAKPQSKSKTVTNLESI